MAQISENNSNLLIKGSRLEAQRHKSTKAQRETTLNVQRNTFSIVETSVRADRRVCPDQTDPSAKTDSVRADLRVYPDQTEPSAKTDSVRADLHVCPDQTDPSAKTDPVRADRRACPDQTDPSAKTDPVRADRRACPDQTEPSAKTDSVRADLRVCPEKPAPATPQQTAILNYQPTLGFTKPEMEKYIKAIYERAKLKLDDKKIALILDNLCQKTTKEKRDFFIVPKDFKTALAKLNSELTTKEINLLENLCVEALNVQPIRDIQNLMAEIKAQLKPELIKNYKEADLLKFIRQIDEKIEWAYSAQGTRQKALGTSGVQRLEAQSKIQEGIPSENYFTEVMDFFSDQQIELLIISLEDFKKELKVAFNENAPEIYKQALDRIAIIQGQEKSPKTISFKDDALQIELSKKQALLKNTDSGITAKLTFGDAEETMPTANKISFNESDPKLKEALEGLGINLKDYATVVKNMPEIRYLNSDEDIPDTVVASKFYESITALFKNQKNLPPNMYKHLEYIKKYADTGDKAYKAACKMAIFVTTLYAVLRVIGVASILLFANGNTALMDQIGAIGLFIGEFAVRVPSSLQYNHIIYQTLAVDKEKFNITQKELDEVRGENGPSMGMLHYFYKEGYIFNGTIETTFLTSTGYWNFSAHHYAIGWGERDLQDQWGGDRHKLKIWENEQKKFTEFITNLNKKVQENWLKYENSLLQTTNDTQFYYNEPINLNCLKNFNQISLNNFETAISETKRLEQLYEELNKAYLDKSDFWRIRTHEYSRSKSMNVMWYNKIADTWAIHGKTFLNKAKENKFTLEEIKNAPPEKQQIMLQKYMADLRSQYRKLEHSFHHKIIIDYSQAYHKMTLESFEQIKEKLQSVINPQIIKSKVNDVIKNPENLRNITLKINEILTLFNRDTIIRNTNSQSEIIAATERIAKSILKFKGKNEASTIEDILPQLVLDYFSYLSYDSGAKPLAQNRIYERFGKTFYLARTDSAKNPNGQMIIEFTEEEFNQYLQKYLDKESFTEKEWDLITEEEWSKMGAITKVFPKKPERRAFPKTRFNYSMDKDYVPQSINPDSGQQEDASTMVAYMLRMQKKGEINVPVLQSRQIYLYDNEYEYLPQAANDDQKPWYGGFVFLGIVDGLYNKVQEIHKFLPEQTQSQSFAKIVHEIGTWIKSQDQYHTIKLWPAVCEVLVNHSEKGLTEQDLDTILKLGEKTPASITSKLSYQLLDKWLSNLLIVLLDQRKATGMGIGKDVDDAMFNCGTCRLEDIQLHRLAMQRFQIMNPTRYYGELQAHHGYVILNNETGDIQKYMLRETSAQASMQQSINPLVDLHKQNDTYLLNLVKEFFININWSQYKNQELTIKRESNELEFYDKNGNRILTDYLIQIVNHPEHLAKNKNRPKIIINKIHQQPDGKAIIAEEPEKIIYQYYQNFGITQGELEEIFGIQETRPLQEVTVFSKNTIGLREKVKGVFHLKEGFLTTFIFDDAIKTESDIDLLDFEPEVKEKIKGLFKKYAKSLIDVGTIIVDYTPSGKIVTDYVPTLTNTRYVSYISKDNKKDILTHTAGTIDISSSQLLELLSQMHSQDQRIINFSQGKIIITKNEGSYKIEITRKNKAVDTYLIKPGENAYFLLFNGKEQEQFGLTEDQGASIAYKGFSGVMRSMAYKLKQILAEEEFTVDYGGHQIGSKAYNEVFANYSLFNRTIYIDDTSTITINGRGNYNLAFHTNDFSASQEKELNHNFLFNLLSVSARSAEKENVGSTSFSYTSDGFIKKGAKWQNIVLKDENNLKHDLRISFVEKKGHEFIYVQDMVSQKSLILPYMKPNSTKEEVLIGRDQKAVIEKIAKWFKNKEVQIVDLAEPELKEILKNQYGDKKVRIQKTRDRSNLALMLINIKELAPAGKFTFKKRINNEEKIFNLRFDLDQVYLNDIKYSNYETAIKALDAILFATSGDVTIESEIITPRLITKMIKTDQNGNKIMEDELSCPKETMPDWWITEDAASTWEQHRRGFQIRYAPFSFSDGVGPETMNEMVQQHKRWALGTMNSFKMEELKKNSTFMNRLVGKQLTQNERWYKHGWYDDPLYDCPVALANSFLAMQNFNPIAVDSAPFWEFPLTSIIVGAGLLATFMNILTYYLDMSRQKTSIKDIFIKESLIGFLGSNSYIMAHEQHVEEIENKFDITSIGGPRERIPYDAIVATNERLAKSVYSTAVFTSLYIYAMATGGLLGFFTPLAFTSALVGFWTTVNAAKLLTGIGAFDGFKNYYDDWKAGFLLDAENKSMELFNETAKDNKSIKDLEKVFAIGQDRIRERISNNERDPIKSENYGNFSFMLDTALERIRKNSDELSVEDIERILNLVTKLYTEIGQQKIGIEFLKRSLYPTRLYIEDLEIILIHSKYPEKITIKDIYKELNPDLKNKIKQKKFQDTLTLKALNELDAGLFSAIIKDLSIKLKIELIVQGVLSQESDIISPELKPLKGSFKLIQDELEKRLSSAMFNTKKDFVEILNNVVNTRDPKGKTLGLANGRLRFLFETLYVIKNMAHAKSKIANSPILHLSLARAYIKDGFLDDALTEIKSALFLINEVSDVNEKVYIYKLAEFLLFDTYHQSAQNNLKNGSYLLDEIKIIDEVFFQEKPVKIVLTDALDQTKQKISALTTDLMTKITNKNLKDIEFIEIAKKIANLYLLLNLSEENKKIFNKILLEKNLKIDVKAFTEILNNNFNALQKFNALFNLGYKITDFNNVLDKIDLKSALFNHVLVANKFKPLHQLELVKNLAFEKINYKKRFYNLFLYNQAISYFNLFQKSKDKADLLASYKLWIRITEKSLEMESIGQEILLALMKNYDSNIQDRLIKDHVEEINNLLYSFQTISNLEFPKNNEHTYLAKLRFNLRTINYRTETEIDNISTDLTKLFKANLIPADYKNLDEIIDYLQSDQFLQIIANMSHYHKSKTVKLKNRVLTSIKDIAVFLPHLSAIEIDMTGKILNIGILKNRTKKKIKSRYYELKALVNNLTSLLPLKTAIKLTPSYDKTERIFMHLSLMKAEKEFSSDTVTVNYIAPKLNSADFNKDGEHKLWAETEASAEDDLYLRQQTLLLRKIMALEGMKVAGINANLEKKLARFYVLGQGNLLRPDLERSEFEATDKKLTRLTVKNIIKRLIELKRYDEALRYYSYFISTLKPEGKIFDPETIGEYIEASFGKVEEETQRNDLKEYADFLSNYGKFLTVNKKNQPLGFLRKTKTKDKTEKIINQRTLAEELNRVQNLINNFMGEKISVAEISKIQEEIAVKNRNLINTNLISTKDKKYLFDLVNLDDKNTNLIVDIFSYLLLNEKKALDLKLLTALDQIKKSISEEEFINLIKIYLQKTDLENNKNLNIITKQIETFIINNIKEPKKLTEEASENLEIIFTEYLKLYFYNQQINFSLIPDFYQKVIGKTPAKSGLFQQFSHKLQDHFSAKMYKNILKIKNLKTENQALFDQTCQQTLDYYHFLVNNKFNNTNTIQQVMHLADSKHLNESQMENLLAELIKLSNFYKISDVNLNSLISLCNDLFIKEPHSSIRSNLFLNAISLKNDTELFITSADNIKQVILKIKSDQQKGEFVKKYLALITIGAQKLLDSDISTANKIKLLQFILNNFDDLADTTILNNNELSSWDLEFLKLSLRLSVLNQIKTNKLFIKDLGNLLLSSASNRFKR